MQQRLKSWESPRKQGRNDKGKGGSARARQLKKKFSTLRQKLKEQSKNTKRESDFTLSFFLSTRIAIIMRVKTDETKNHDSTWYNRHSK